MRLIATLILLGIVGLTWADEKLQPLQYNHPGLTVDLGVGLWAYPLPIDYDNDGDLDLVVSCPDKPSGGTYWFENPTQDPNIKMPVFKPAIRLGDGHHYMLLSHVGDQPVILRPGQIYRRGRHGRFDFTRSDGAGLSKYPISNDHIRVRGNMWRMVDYNGDGNSDIVVGTGDWSALGWDHAYDASGVWQNGPLHGTLDVFLNRGTGGDFRFDIEPFRIQAGGEDLDVYGWPVHNFADFDDDGDLDILTGDFLDRFTYFQNVGTRNDPVYERGDLLNDADGRPLIMDLQMITPTAIDWDADGDMDLIVGDEDGRVALVENTGELRDRRPVFRSPVYFRQRADKLKFGALATPFVFDWDGDGDEDIVCGNTAGQIGFFENLGDVDGSTPRWAAPVLLNVRDDDGNVKRFRVLAGPNGSIQGPCEAKWGYTTLSVADWDGDGDGDILYNSILARIGLLRNDDGVLVEVPIGTAQPESPAAWYAHVKPTSSTLTQWRTTPIATDFDGDKNVDLVMMDQAGFLTLRSRTGKDTVGPAQRIFVDESGQPFRLTSGTAGRSGRVKLSMVDWDGDGQTDVLINSENATLVRNMGVVDGKIVLRRMGNLAKRNVAGHTSSPAFADFDHDGKPDLIVGSENGRIYHIAHDDCLAYSADDPSPAVAPEPSDPPIRDGKQAVRRETTRGPVAVWVAKSQLRFSFHDGNHWSGQRAIVEVAESAEISNVQFDPDSQDAELRLTFTITDDDGAARDEVRVSYDRGRTFRKIPGDD